MPRNRIHSVANRRWPSLLPDCFAPSKVGALPWALPHVGVCATPGGGFALMSEGLGMSAMIETPVVVIDVERAGPSSGVSTDAGRRQELRLALQSAEANRGPARSLEQRY